MSLPSCVPAISSNTKKEDATRNIPVSPLFASETLSNAEESSSHQPEQRCAEEDEAAEARDRETCEVMCARIGEQHFSLEALLEQLPSPPSRHPNDMKDGPTCSTTASGPPSTSSVHRATSGGSSLSRDSYTWSIASSDLPFSLSHDEEKLVWPLQETFDIQDNQFEEGVQYDIIEEIGGGAFGKCYVASTSSDPPLFCIKKCEYKVNEILALYQATKEEIKEIVGFYGAKLEGRNAYICMEYMTGGTLSDLVEKQKKSRAGVWPIIPEDTCFVFLEDILKGLKFLNGKGLVHRDIKGDNVLLDGEGIHAKLTDFGSAEDIQEPGGWSDDIWKTGCLHLEMLNGKCSPLFGVKGGGLQRQSSVQPEKHFPSQAKEETRELLNLFFGINREYMPSAAEILRVARVFQVNKSIDLSR